MNKLIQLWDRLFLEERSSLSLCLFRIALAFTVISHVIPSFFHMGDNYLATAYKEYNISFFPRYVIEWVMQSPDWLIYLFVWIFCIFSFFFLIGLFSQLSAILTMLSCYYFYALSSFHVGTLSWDILLVTLFLMCLVPYYGDYFSVDSFFRVGKGYQSKRPYFIQRLLQLQIGLTFFYTALWKIYPKGNWLQANPIYYLMHKPPAGVTKWFLFRDFLKEQPELCYWIGISVIIAEFILIFLLFWRKTRISAIYMGVFFHVVLVLTLDVPATFFFLFPAQLLLFINPQKIVQWIDEKRICNESADRPVILYDGQCRFCRWSIKRLIFMDLFAKYQYVDFRQIDDIKSFHADLTVELCERQVVLIDSRKQLHGGFFVFRKISFSMPMMFPLILVFYFPGMGLIGPIVYHWIARNRYRFVIKAS